MPKNDFSNFFKYIDDLKDAIRYVDLAKYGLKGVKALADATPKDSGLTADSWYYVIEHNEEKKTYTLSWYNDNITKDYFPIAIMLQYGHATNNGGYVKGRDYINPALQPIFDELAENAWKEVTKL